MDIISVRLGKFLCTFTILVNKVELETSKHKSEDDLNFQFGNFHSCTRMTSFLKMKKCQGFIRENFLGNGKRTSTPAKIRKRPFLIFLPSWTKPRGIEIIWSRIYFRVQVGICYRVSDEIPRLNDAASECQILLNVTTKSGPIYREAKGFSDNKLKYRHFVFPCREVDGCEPFV